MEKSQRVFSKKSLTTMVVVLLIGVVVAPSINTSVIRTTSKQKSSGIIVDVCGFNTTESFAMPLRTNEGEELDTLFGTIQTRLDDAETQAEAIEIFNEAVVELDEQDLLPTELSVAEAQSLVTGEERHPQFVRVLRRIYYGNHTMVDDQVNLLCLVAGNITRSFCIPSLALQANNLGIFVLILADYVAQCFPQLEEYVWSFFTYFGIPHLLLLTYTLFFSLYLSSELKIPCCVGNAVGVGSAIDSPTRNVWIVKPATGWMHTFGLNGKTNNTGDFYGQFIPPYVSFIFVLYPGVLGFTGIRIFNENTGSTYFLGFALAAKLGPDKPLFP